MMAVGWWFAIYSNYSGIRCWPKVSHGPSGKPYSKIGQERVSVGSGELAWTWPLGYSGFWP
jgi:hypothetical protein